MFYTRLPVPGWVRYSDDILNRASRYFPLVGLIVGAIGALTFWLGDLVFDPSIALLLSLIATVLATGAFHEDGFADLCDGFGGGWTQSQVLAIMKDSRLGTYGTVGLVGLLALKFATLISLPATWIPLALLIAHPLSRFAAISFVYSHDYVQEDAQSKVKPLALNLSLGELILAAITGVAPLLILMVRWDWRWGIALGTVATARWALGRLFVRRLGGYTGDCLGAAQQVTEAAVYLALAGL